MSDNDTALTVATVGLVLSTFGAMLPQLADVRAHHELSDAQKASVRTAGLLAGALVGAIAYSSHSKEAAAVGGVAVVALTILYTQASGAVWTSHPAVPA